VTNDSLDPSVDVFRTVTLPLLRRAAGAGDGLELRIARRGARPGGGGEVSLRAPAVKALPAVGMLEEGMVKRVRGIAYSTKVGVGGRGGAGCVAWRPGRRAVVVVSEGGGGGRELAWR
jgi:RNA 3'-terminal phosphate cyclase